jgi:PAS domain S-box-containing protein
MTYDHTNQADLTPEPEECTALASLLFRECPLPLALLEADTLRFLAVNPALLGCSGAAPDELLGQPAATLFAAEDAGRLVQAVTQVPDALPRRSTYRRRDGRLVEVDIGSQPLTYGGRPARLVVAQDITERESLREGAAETEHRLEALVNSVDGIVWEYDPESARFSYVSPQAERILGYPRAEWLNRPDFWQDLLHPEERDRVVAAYRAARLEGRTHRAEYRLRHALGGWRWVRDYTTNGRNGRLHSRGLMMDITEARATQAELQRSEEQLREAQKMEIVGQLASGVAHDFNNLLTTILGSVEALLVDPATGGRGSPELHTIRHAARSAGALTKQLLTVGRRVALEPRVIDLNDLITGLESLLRPAVGAGIVLTIRQEPGLHPVLVDPHQIEMVLLNLVLNARDAMPAGGELLLATSNLHLDQEYANIHHGVAAGDYVRLTVSDSGHGMNAATLARIFEPFFTTKPAGRGTGMGLASAYGAVKQSGGHIGVYSEPGRGSTFRIDLPRAGSPVPGAAPQSAEVQPRRERQNILVVDDDLGVQRIFMRQLTPAGYRVLQASSAEEALSLVRRFPTVSIDLAIIDQGLPDMPGAQLATELAALRPKVRLLLTSGYLAPSGSEAKLPFLEKPFSRESLLRAVLAALGQSDPEPGRG